MPSKPKPPVKTALEQWAEDHGVAMTEAIVPLDRIHPNPWNPNVMDDVTKTATRDSIAMFGFIDHPHVRAHPELDGHYQLLDGEHRIREARELEYDTIPVIVLDVDTPTAMKLTIVLNQKGTNDDVRLGALLGELQQHGGEDWTKALAFDPSALQHLIELGAGDWTPPPPGGDLGGAGAGAGVGAGQEGWVTIEALVPDSVMALWADARDKAGERDELSEHDDPRIAAGKLLEVLIASYLASE